MLVSKKIDYTNRVVALKLVTGEEIIARVVQDTADTLSLKRPLAMVMMQGGDEDGTQGAVAFAPWMLALPDDAVVELNRSRIVYVHEARRDAAEEWVKAVGDHEGPRTAPMEATASRGRR